MEQTPWRIGTAINPLWMPPLCHKAVAGRSHFVQRVLFAWGEKQFLDKLRAGFSLANSPPLLGARRGNLTKLQH